MTLETFFEKFDQFADAPNAVAKMRELVRHIAVTGKLVPQDPNDGDARKMIDHAMERRQQAIQTKSLRRKELDESADLFEHEDLPSSWCVERFANLVDPENTISYGVLVPGNDVPDGIPFVRAQDLCLSNHPARPNKTIAPEIEKPYARTRLTGGEILLCVVGSIGKLGVVPDSWAGANIARAVARIKPIPDVLRDYLLLVLQDKSVQNYFASTTRTLAQPTLNVGMIEQTPIPVPPLAEQKRIVAKVDELMALCDRLEAQQQKREEQASKLARASLTRFADAPTPANLHFLFHSSFSIHPSDLRKSILTLAVQGKLVPQDPNDEPADVFLGQIAQRLDKSKGKRSANNGAATADKAEPFDLPPGWAWSRFHDLGEFGRGKSKHRPRNDRSLFIDGKHRLVQTGDVARANGTIETHTGLYNDVGLAQSKMWPAGTLCITIAANIADSGILGFDACFPDSVVGFIPAPPIPSVRYFEYFMRTAKEHLEQFAPATAQKNINLGILEQVWIPIPPLAEQRRIVAKVEQLMALVCALETQLATSRATAANLLSALVAELTAAF